ncbi:MAG TPA: hypothetical protein VE914_00110 [Candidatus Angelobacter sp.]|nr:hypothetical protein [Candidatus Angelobacter sp.]
MQKSLVAAALLVALAACADEPAQPANQPSNQNYPIPPVKPRLPQASALQGAFTDYLPLARTL